MLFAALARLPSMLPKAWNSGRIKRSISGQWTASTFYRMIRSSSGRKILRLKNEPSIWTQCAEFLCPLSADVSGPWDGSQPDGAALVAGEYIGESSPNCVQKKDAPRPAEFFRDIPLNVLGPKMREQNAYLLNVFIDIHEGNVHGAGIGVCGSSECHCQKRRHAAVPPGSASSLQKARAEAGSIGK